MTLACTPRPRPAVPRVAESGRSFRCDPADRRRACRSDVLAPHLHHHDRKEDDFGRPAAFRPVKLSDFVAHDVFISYATSDKAVADAVCSQLESIHRIRCWIAPRDVTPGASWAESIIDALDGSKIMVLIFSSNANASMQIEREVERAVHKGINIIPLRIENTVPTKTLEYFISAPHWLDALSVPLEDHINKLAASVKACFRTWATERSAAAVRSRRSAASTTPRATNWVGRLRSRRLSLRRSCSAFAAERAGRPMLSITPPQRRCGRNRNCRSGALPFRSRDLSASRARRNARTDTDVGTANDAERRSLPFA